MIRVAINGFGRIGTLAFRSMITGVDFDIVAKRTLPLISLWMFISIPFLNLGIHNLPSSIVTNWGIVKLCLSYLLLNLGNLVCFLKNLL